MKTTGFKDVSLHSIVTYNVHTSIMVYVWKPTLISVNFSIDESIRDYAWGSVFSSVWRSVNSVLVSVTQRINENKQS